MASSPQLQTVIQMVKGLVEKPAETIDEMRANFAAAMAGFRVADDVTCTPVQAGGVPAEWIVAPGAAADRVLMYLHGGGYVVCSVSTHRDLMARLSRASGARVLGVDYRLAPEHPFPAAVEDATTAYRWLVSSGIPPGRIAIGGDSAGGGLTLATMVALRDAGDPLPAAGVCLCPWVDLEGVGASMTGKAAEDPFVRREMIEFMAQQYLGERDRRTPLAAPLYADLRGLPPLLIQVGSAEVLLDDATRIAERAKAAGVKVDLEVWDDMIHIWQIFAPMLPEGQQAIERLGAFIREHTS
ncbi:MAG TPA: alpha/beta hydrolase [Alphaproteobacteria bacterium]|nr:alpha/beta hydrolase [Alphaproteobacteria bacterium]